MRVIRRHPLDWSLTGFRFVVECRRVAEGTIFIPPSGGVLDHIAFTPLS